MARALPALRRNLDVMPSPVEDRPGVLLRDPFRYTEDVLIVPPALVPFLGYFDGAHDEGDLRLALRRDAAVGTVEVEGLVRHLEDALGRGFLRNDAFTRLREDRQRTFAEAERREPAHAGSAYPAERGLARGIAPHVPGGGRRRSGCGRRLRDRGAARQPRRRLPVLRRGLQRALCPRWRTGPSSSSARRTTASPSASGSPASPTSRRSARPAPTAALVDGARTGRRRRGAPRGLLPRGRALDRVPGDLPAAPLRPRACASSRSCAGRSRRATYEGGRPEDDEGVRALPGRARRARRPRGRSPRSGCSESTWRTSAAATAIPLPPAPAWGRWPRWRSATGARIERILAGDAAGLLGASVEEGGDDLKWCGASPLYTFLEARRPRRGARCCATSSGTSTTTSVVSFAGLAFRRETAPGPAPKGDA